MDMFGLTPSNLPIEGAFGLTDCRMSILLLPWSIKDYANTGIVGPGMDYIGFKVENLEKFKEDVKAIADSNPLIAPSPVGSGPEGAARLEMLQRTSLGSWHTADPDGVLLDIVT